MSLPTVLIDSYHESNADYEMSLNGTFPDNVQSALGQSFRTPDNGKTRVLNYASFYLSRDADFEGTFRIDIYAHSGTYGTSSLPTGDPLASSDELDEGDVSSSSYALIQFPFTGDQKITLQPNTCYVAFLKQLTNNQYNGLLMKVDVTSPTHAGNFITYSTV
jgi:hypothetical protein